MENKTNSMSNKKNKLLIVGGGYLSTNLKNYFRNKNIQVDVLKKETYNLCNRKTIDDVVKIIKLNKYTAVFYAAFDKGKSNYWWRVNVTAPLKIVESLKNSDIRFIFPGSLAEITRYMYLAGQTNIEVSTASPPSFTSATSFYGANKEVLREQLEKLSGDKNIRCKISWIRISTVYGGEMPPHHLFHKILDAAINNKEVRLRLKDSVRNYIHIETICECINHLIHRSQKNTMEIYALCGEQTHTLGEVVEMIVSALKEKGHEVQLSAFKYGTWPFAEKEVGLKHKCSSLFEKILKNQPKLEDEICHIVERFLQQQNTEEKYEPLALPLFLVPRVEKAPRPGFEPGSRE